MEAAERDPEPASWMTWDQTSQDFQQQLRHVFDICDVDRDGLVTAGDFRRLTQPHVDSEEVSINVITILLLLMSVCNERGKKIRTRDNDMSII